MDLTQVLGLVFTHPRSGTEYGVIRPPSLGRARLPHTGDRIVGEDEAGNAFVVRADGGVGFWDHETAEVAELADNWPDFVRGCAPPSSVRLDPNQVRSAWIDPDFARELRVDAPPDGWKKRPRSG